MGVALYFFVIFLSLVWLGMMLIALSPLFRKKQREYGPGKREDRVLVIVPCKGEDIELQKNLESLKDQDCPNYDLVAVVDRATDRSIGLIKRAGIRYILSSKRYRNCSGKVAAIITAMRKYPTYDIYVNIDSDVRCRKDHIRKLVAPLQDGKVGASTAYPYFVPVSGFWSSVKMVWGFVGNGMMGSSMTRFIWGGSMAFRKGLIGRKEFDIFEGALSDDMAISYFTKRKGLSIAYIDSNSTQVMASDSFSSFWEWSNRQTALSILGNRGVLYYGLAFYGGQILLLLSGIALFLLISPLFLVLLLPFAIGVWKNYRRATSKRIAAIPISMVINFVFFANLVAASRMRQIEWRGRRYELSNPF